MRNLKKLVALIVTIAMIATFAIPAFAETKTDADICTDLGVLKGAGSGVTAEYLAAGTTRLQAAIIYLRLIGKEAAALAYEGTEKFADQDLVTWTGGNNVLSYLKANPGLGWIGNAGKFDPYAPATVAQIYKVMLESLGYRQGLSFDWSGVMDFAATKGLAALKDVAELKNSNLATAIVEALKATIINSTTTLAEKLVASGTITEEKATANGLINVNFAVTSVSALNGKSVEIKFNKAVKADTVIAAGKLINITFTAVGAAPAINSALADAALSTDGKTLTVTPQLAEYFNGNYAVTVSVSVLDTASNAIKAYSAISSLLDSTRPGIASVSYPANNVATVAFTEAMNVANAAALEAAMVITSDTGANVPTAGLVTLAADKKSFDLNITGWTASKAYTVQIVGVSDFSGKLINPNPASFTVTNSVIDNVAPTLVSVTALDIGKAKATFSEKITTLGSFKINGGLAIPIIAGGNATVDTTGTILTITDAGFTAGVKALTFTGYKDASANAGADATKLVQFAADTVKPTYVSHQVMVIGGVQYLIVKYSENVVADNAAGDLTGTYLDANSVTYAATIADGGTTLYDADLDGVSDSIKIDLTGKAAGTYTVTVTAGLAKDTSAAANASVAQSVSFSIGTVGDTGKPTVAITAVQVAEDKVKLTFSENVTPASALNVNNYLVEGAAVFASAIFDGAQNVVTLTLKPNQFAVTGLRNFTISGVADLAGNVMDSVTSQTVFKENLKPVVASAALTSATTVVVTFNESVTVAANAFEFYIDGVKAATCTNGGVTATTVTLTVDAITDLTKTFQVKLVGSAVDASGNTAATGALVTVSK